MSKIRLEVIIEYSIETCNYFSLKISIYLYIYRNEYRNEIKGDDGLINKKLERKI